MQIPNRMIATALVVAELQAGLIGSVHGEGNKTPPVAPMPSTPEQRQEEAPPSCAGALDVRIHPEEGRLDPPAELLLTDTKGRKIGTDPRTKKNPRDVPDAFYERESIADDETGAPGPESAIIDIRNPAGGTYRLQVIGTRSGAYDLQVTAYDCELNPSHTLFTSVKIRKGLVHDYSIRYANQTGAKIEVTATPSNPHRSGQKRR